MAGTAVVYRKDDISANRASPGLMKEIGDSLTAIMVDIEVLRTGLALAEDFILEVDTALDAKIFVAVSSYDLTNLADGAGATAALTTASGAVLGDFVMCSMGVDLEDIYANAYVQAANKVTAWFQLDNAGADVDLSSTTLRYLVTPKAQGAIVGTVTASALSSSAFNAAGDMTGYDITIS